MKPVKEGQAFWFAAFAGALAAFAGFSMKAALSSEETYSSVSHVGSLIVRAVFLGCSLAANSVMLTFTAKSTLLSSSVQAVTTSTAVNFTISVLLGVLIFREHVGLLGMFGVLVIQAGLYLLNT